MRFLKKSESKLIPVSTGEIQYACGENNKSGIPSRHVPVWRGLISIVLSVIHSGPKNYYGIDRMPVCTGSGMYRLHCILLNVVMNK